MINRVCVSTLNSQVVIGQMQEEFGYAQENVLSHFEKRIANQTITIGQNKWLFCTNPLRSGGRVFDSLRDSTNCNILIAGFTRW
jgi:hypothetical protein